MFHVHEDFDIIHDFNQYSVDAKQNELYDRFNKTFTKFNGCESTSKSLQQLAREQNNGNL